MPNLYPFICLIICMSFIKINNSIKKTYNNFLMEQYFCPHPTICIVFATIALLFPIGGPDKELITKLFTSIAKLFSVFKRNNFNLLVSLSSF